MEEDGRCLLWAVILKFDPRRGQCGGIGMYSIIYGVFNTIFPARSGTDGEDNPGTKPSSFLVSIALLVVSRHLFAIQLPGEVYLRINSNLLVVLFNDDWMVYASLGSTIPRFSKCHLHLRNINNSLVLVDNSRWSTSQAMLFTHAEQLSSCPYWLLFVRRLRVL